MSMKLTWGEGEGSLIRISQGLTGGQVGIVWEKNHTTMVATKFKFLNVVK
jgi:hypothetical protein